MWINDHQLQLWENHPESLGPNTQCYRSVTSSYMRSTQEMFQKSRRHFHQLLKENTPWQICHHLLQTKRRLKKPGRDQSKRQSLSLTKSDILNHNCWQTASPHPRVTFPSFYFFLSNLIWYRDIFYLWWHWYWFWHQSLWGSPASVLSIWSTRCVFGIRRRQN